VLEMRYGRVTAGVMELGLVGAPKGLGFRFGCVGGLVIEEEILGRVTAMVMELG
jgi:hypothetical protein